MAMTPLQQGLAALVAATILMCHAQVVEGTCTPPYHELAGICTEPGGNAWLPFEPTQAVGAATAIFSAEAADVDAPAGYSAFVGFEQFRADTLTLKITADAAKPDLYLVVRENGVFHSEINIFENNNAAMVFTARGYRYSRGIWQVTIVNWGESVIWNTDIITTFEMSCANAAEFRYEAFRYLCTPPVCSNDLQHVMPSNTCESPESVLGGKLYVQESGSTPAVKQFVGAVASGVHPLQFKQYFEFTAPYSSMKIEITIDPDTNSEAPHLYLQVTNNNEDFFDDIATADGVAKVYTKTASQAGHTWQVRLVNWAPDGSPQVVRPSRVQIRQFCEGGSEFYLQTYLGNSRMACMPFRTECQVGTRNWNNKGCIDPTVVLSAGNQLEVEPNDAGSSESSKAYVGKSGLAKVIAPKEALIVELENVRSNRLTVQLLNPDGATPPDLEVHVYVIDADRKEYVMAGAGATGGQSKAYDMPYEANLESQQWGQWRIAVVNWALESATVPLSWLKLNYDCSSSEAFTGQGNGISSCTPVFCPVGKRKPVGEVECVLPEFVEPTFEFTFTAEEPPSIGIASLAFVGQAATITLQPGTGVVYELPNRAESLLFTVAYDQENPDIWVRVSADGIPQGPPFEFQPEDNSYRSYLAEEEGRYTFEVVNWGATPQVFKPENFVGRLFCYSSGFAVGLDGVNSCVLPKCPLGTLRVDACDAVSFPVDFTIPVTSNSPNAATRVLTPKPVFSTVKGMTGVSIIADNLRADRLEVTIPPPTYDGHIQYWYGVIFNGDTIVDQFSLAVENYKGARQYTSTATGENKGKWRVAVGMYSGAINNDPGYSSLWLPVGVTVKFSCDFGDFQSADGPIEACLPSPSKPPTPPSPALSCAYTETVGFNPWERWNLFAFVGKMTLNGSSVEGRVAGVADVDALSGATVHTVKESFIPKREDSAASGPWSVTAGGNVKLDGAATAVNNGGIEAAGTIDKVNGATFSGTEADTKTAVSDLLASAAEYFGGRSATWGALAPSWVSHTPTATELVVQLHGKVNVAEVTVEAMAGVEKITLTGHPVGTLIVNVKGTGTLVLKPTLQVTYKGHGASPTQPPTFGRVLLNIPDATAIVFAAAGPAMGPLHVSILAPQAALTFDGDAPQVKGTVMAHTITVQNDFALQPFGTLAHRLAAPTPVSPAPKRLTSSTGRSRTACLWHAL